MRANINRLIVLTISLVLLLQISFAVNPSYTVNFLNATVNSGKYDIDIYIIKNAGSGAFRLGNANFWFTYTSSSIDNPVIKTNGIYDAATNNDYNAATLTSGTYAGLPYVSYNVLFNGTGDLGLGQTAVTTGNGTLVCTIEFDITDPSGSNTSAFQSPGYAVVTDVGADITSYGTWTSNVFTSPLPVELTSFTASVSQLNSDLNWSTATEVNNYGFDVERRTVSSQLSAVSTWQKVGFVQGNGTSNVQHSYSFSDKVTVSGTYAYRLKQIDNSGAFKYSQEAEVTIEVPKVFMLNQNYPNPFNPTTTISFTLAQDGMTTLKIFDITGREVATLANGMMKAGVVQQVTFDASRLSSGIYFSCLESNGLRQIKKLMLMK